jgi:hypothetical protein
MKKIVTLLMLGFVLNVAGIASEPAPVSDISIQTLGLKIDAPLPEGIKDDKMYSFSGNAGTTVSLLIFDPSGGIVLFDSENSKLTKFVDGKGSDLLAKPAKKGKDDDQARHYFGSHGFSRFNTISADGKACKFEVSGPSIPAKGSGTIKIEGSLSLLCAKEKKEFVLKDLALKKGTKLNADKTELTIATVGKPDWGDEPLKVSLKAQDTELNEVAEIKFFKADGSEIKSHKRGSSKMGMLGAMTVEWDYVLSEKVESATVKMYLWVDMQKKSVPLNVSVDVGL